MGTIKGKPRGYFEYILAVDCETTGLCFENYENDENPTYNPTTGERHQAISWAFMLVRAEDFAVLDELYVKVKWNENSLQQRLKNPSFGKNAEQIHGLTIDHLEENGIDEEEAVSKIGELILKWFGPDNPIRLLGHNVHLFDLAFLRDLFKRHDILLKFANRHLDSSSLGFGTVGAFNSDDLFATFGFEERGCHSSLEDIRMTVDSLKIINQLWKIKVGLNAYRT